MKHIAAVLALVTAGVLCAGTTLQAQTAPATYWVQFTNKDNTPFSLHQPEAFSAAVRDFLQQ